MDDEIDALISCQTWDLVHTSPGLSMVSSRLMFTIKHPLDDIVG